MDKGILFLYKGKAEQERIRNMNEKLYQAGYRAMKHPNATDIMRRKRLQYSKAQDK